MSFQFDVVMGSVSIGSIEAVSNSVKGFSWTSIFFILLSFLVFGESSFFNSSLCTFFLFYNSLGIKARTVGSPPTIVPPRLYFWDSDRSHYIVLQGQQVSTNATLTLPHVTAELAYKGQNISVFTNNFPGFCLSTVFSAYRIGVACYF